MSATSTCRTLGKAARTVSALHDLEAFSIYIHWPYCESKCTYCNFNKYVNPQNPPAERLTNAINTELTFYLTEPRFNLKAKKVSSVYFGGGTPSLAPPSTIRSILETIDRHNHLQSGIEISMEANPTSLKRLREFREAGVNRLSLGIQSFNDSHLATLGRDHTGSDSIQAILHARSVFDRVSFDMIFGRPNQTLRDWQQELNQALDLAGDHLSLYQLSLERGTPLFRQVQKMKLPALDDDILADMYEATVQMTQERGFAHYEVSNYARTQNGISRHNVSYWQSLDYLGVGPGAHGRLTDMIKNERIRTFGEFHPNRYMESCESLGEGARQWRSIKASDMLQEYIMFGLRTRMGVSRSRFQSLTGKTLDSVIDQNVLAMYVDAGFIVDEKGPWPEQDRYTPAELLNHGQWYAKGGLRPTESGLARMDTILSNIMNVV